MKLKKIKQITLICLITVFSGVLLAGCTNVQSGTFINHTENVQNDTWTFSATRANGHSTRNIEMNEDNLTKLYVNSTNDSGNISLILTQGEFTHYTDLTSGFNGFIDTQEFNPGQISLRLQFENAEGIKISISWSVDE